MFDDLEPFSNIPNFLNTFSKDQCSQLDSAGHSFNLVEMGGNLYLLFKYCCTKERSCMYIGFSCILLISNSIISRAI